jgi:antitoxin HicB
LAQRGWLSAKEGGFVITFPDFDWGVTQADTEAEAEDMAADALGMIIGEYIRKGLALPPVRKHRGRKYRDIRLPALHSAKVALYAAFVESGLRKAELARQLGIPRMNIDRLFDLKHQSRLEQIEAALRILGKELEVKVRDAAA